MYSISALVLSILVSGSRSVDVMEFPPEFMFGAATAAYQVEGAWNVSDKGESIWDHMLHERPELTGGDNGDVACDSYRLWRRDIEMCKELGLNMYRFSISWSRMLPTGFPTVISEDGKNYYNNLIDELVANGIEPLATIYHFDLPQSFQDLGGWANPLIVDWFADYARVVYTLFGDRVKYWLTLNEPFVICDGGYNQLTLPFFDDRKVGRYLCNKNTMLAHAKAWRIYDEEFRSLYNGKVSLTTIFVWFEPKTPEDEEIAQLTTEHMEGRYAHPIFSKEGGWPPAIEKFLNDHAKKQGYIHPVLPKFTADELDCERCTSLLTKSQISGTYDFYGLNFYYARTASKEVPPKPDRWPFYGNEELGVTLGHHPSWEVGTSDWFSIAPKTLRKTIQWIYRTYGVRDVMITENGYVTPDRGLNDQLRLKYMVEMLEQVLLCIQDGLNMMGYNAWSLMDNLEWLIGYKVNYGLYAVDFKDPNKTRTPRESARYYSRVTRTRQLRHEHVGLNYILI